MTTETLEKERVYTVAKYLEIDKGPETKLEFHDGKIIAMSGGSTTHSSIAVKMLTTLYNLLEDQAFEVCNSDVKVQIPAYNRFVYPDVMVVSQKPVYFRKRKDTITNPLLVVEVLSPSTQKHDPVSTAGTDKFMMSGKEFFVCNP